MPSSSLLNVPKDKTGWDEWSFNHAQQHINIIQAIQKQKGIQLNQYQLYPINFSNEATTLTFLEWHQQTHLDMNNALGLQSVDLQDTNLKDQKQLESFVYYNFLEHFDANQALGI